MFTVHHCGHSSVLLLESGQCVEVRRGTLRHYTIPNPRIWNSMQEWYAYASCMQSDLIQRSLPNHFNSDQVWMAQWHESSTLQLMEDTYGCWKLFPCSIAYILVMDDTSGQLHPLYMNLKSGTMYINGQYFSKFSELQFTISQIWRFEMGVYYRLL